MLTSTGKAVFLAGCRFVGIDALLRRMHRDSLLILCYHGVTADDHPEDSYRCRNAVSVREFRSHLELLGRLFTPVSVQEVDDWLAGRAALKPRSALITFDDGFRNNVMYAVPQLERYGFPAAFFVITGYIGRRRMLWTQEVDEIVLQAKFDSLKLPGGQRISVPSDSLSRTALAQRIRLLCKTLPDDQRQAYVAELRSLGDYRLNDWHAELYDFMSWDEVRAVAEHGFTIGSHTVEHPILSRLERAALDNELQASKATIEGEVGRECRWLAYPNGSRSDVSPAVFEAAARAGYTAGFMLTGGYTGNPPRPFAINRAWIPAQERVSCFHARISGLIH